MSVNHWLRAVSGTFATAADWSSRVVPGSADDAILDAAGAVFTVSVTQAATVNSIQLASNARLDLRANFTAGAGTGTGANAGAILVENGQTLTLQGTVNNVGSIDIIGTVSTTSIVLGAGGVTLTGGGPIFLDFSGAHQQIVPAAGGSVLTDVDDRISGRGLLGGAGLTIINEAGGFLEAKAGALIITTGANTIINAGLIDAEGFPGDDNTVPPAQGTVESPVNNSGIVKADGVGATMTFDDDVTGTGRGVIAGGILAFKGGFNQNVAFEATTGELDLAQSVNYTSQIELFSKTPGSDILDLGDIAFGAGARAGYSGTASGGVLTVTDGVHTAHIAFEGDYTAQGFALASDGVGGTRVTISGPKALHWLTAASGSFQAAADWTGGMVPASTNDAILDAAGAAYTITASGSVTLNGVQSASNAVLGVSGAFAILAGSDGGVCAGRIAVADGGTLTAAGVLDNTGTVSLSAASRGARLLASGALTLTGGGAVILGASVANVIAGVGGAASLTNLNNTITGAGDIGSGGLILVNGAAGVIDASAGTVLIVDTGATPVANDGLMEATGTGGLVIRDSGVDGAGGGVILAASGARVALQGADLIGGTLRSLGTGRIATFTGGLDTLDGRASAVANQALVNVQNGTALAIEGAIVNTGQIQLTGAGLATTLTVGAAGATLSGGGKVTLGSNASNVIVGANGASRLTNVDNNISGAGRLGAGSMTLVNQAKGIIVGTLPVALTLDTGTNAILNAGVIAARGAGGTILQSAVANSGILESTGGTLTVNGAVSGAGRAMVYSGTLDFASAFSQAVYFQATSGVLELAQSQAYGATIFGFSKTGGTSLDLRDIAFGGATTASYGGTASAGVLTVTDGTHNAHIHLAGDYLTSSFIASSDGHGGTKIVDPAGQQAAAATLRFVAAAAGMPSAAGGPALPSPERLDRAPLLARPGSQQA